MDNNGKILDLVLAQAPALAIKQVGIDAPWTPVRNADHFGVFDEYGADDTANTPVMPSLGEVKALAPGTARLETTNVFGTFNALCANLDQAMAGASTLPRLASLREVDETLQRVVMACEAAILKAERLRKANR